MNCFSSSEKYVAEKKHRTVPLADSITHIRGYPTKLTLYQIEASPYWWVRYYIDGRIIKRINALLDEREIQMRSNTSLATKIVRLIFGDCGKRAYTYAKVITVAAAEKPAMQSMQTFIANAGGVEEVRRNNPDKVNASVQRTERKQYAETVLDVRKPIVSTKIEMTDELEPSSNSVLPLSIALVRKNRDGSGSIVFGTANQAVLNKVLEIAGKQLQEIEDAAKASDARSEQLEERAAVVAAA